MIEFDGPVPVYRQIAAILRTQIEAGELPPNARVPSEKDLMDTYGVGRDTARAVVALLRDEGYVYTVATRGTFVAER
ncbi:MAG: GntR family transcriptional regulator [Carbonactinosporaceae bacterium]